ncbi:MAG TPA: hypothetical protein VGV93_08750 [Acidimicrobiales bacterium]|nr:hypothetical protein [Acidimicrobiales bacterium]
MLDVNNFDQLRIALATADSIRTWSNGEVLSASGQALEMREADEDAFRAAEELGIDLSRPERYGDEFSIGS